LKEQDSASRRCQSLAGRNYQHKLVGSAEAGTGVSDVSAWELAGPISRGDPSGTRAVSNYQASSLSHPLSLTSLEPSPFSNVRYPRAGSPRARARSARQVGRGELAGCVDQVTWLRPTLHLSSRTPRKRRSGTQILTERFEICALGPGSARWRAPAGMTGYGFWCAVANSVILGFVPRIQSSAGSGARCQMDPRDEPEDDSGWV
jgi:hypothetical protein